MFFSKFVLGASARWHYFLQYSRRHPAYVATGWLFIIFSIYLLNTARVEFIYDASLYWNLAQKYWESGDFNLLSYNNVLRGYLFPLLLSGLFRLYQYLPVSPIDLTRALGAIIAALLFGTVIPGLWQSLQSAGRPLVTVERRLLLGALGFLFWRDYFHFPLTDFPAVLALTGSLWAIVRGRSVSSGFLAGVCIAAALNFRPVYATSLPIIIALSFWPPIEQRNSLLRVWGRRIALAFGIALIMWPQMVINQVHFGSHSPLVLTNVPNQPSLYLSQLQWGLCYQKYETNVGTDYAGGRMFFLEKTGQQLWDSTGLTTLKSYTQYAHIAQSHPLTVVMIWLRHLFNGLDLQYSSPYIQRVYASSWGPAALNYFILLSGLRVLIRCLRHQTFRNFIRTTLVLSALFGPCLFTLPVAMECRFLVPLHLTLSAAFAFGIQPINNWVNSSVRHRFLIISLYTSFIAVCFIFSANAQYTLEKGPRYIFKWQRPNN